MKKFVIITLVGILNTLTNVGTSGELRNTTKNITKRRRILTSTDVYYGICYRGIDFYPQNLITEDSYIEYLKCHPKKLFNLKTHIRHENSLIKLFDQKQKFLFIFLCIYAHWNKNIFILRLLKIKIFTIPSWFVQLCLYLYFGFIKKLSVIKEIFKKLNK